MCDGGEGSADSIESGRSPEPAGDFAVNELKQSFLDGLAELQKRLEAARAVGRQGNEIAVWLGVWNLNRYDTEYEEDETGVFAFLPAHFPEGDPHWVVFAPSPTPANRSLSNENNARSNKFSRYVQNHFGADSPLAWSLRWSNAGYQPDNPKNMIRQAEIIRTALDLG